MATLYLTNGRTQEVRPSNGEHFTPDELENFVGGWIETVRTHDGGYMVINEMGKVQNPPLDLNVAATRLYESNINDWIAGPAIVTHSLFELIGPEDVENGQADLG